MGQTVLFGGSFNPPHEGHLAIIHTLLGHEAISTVLVCPAYVSPFKSRDAFVMSDNERLSKLETLMETIPQASVITLELDRKGDSYTVDTLVSLKQSTPNLAFAIGQDSYLSLHKWREVKKLFKLAHVYVVPRGSDTFIQNEALTQLIGDQLAQKVTFLPMPLNDAASTDLRG